MNKLFWLVFFGVLLGALGALTWRLAHHQPYVASTVASETPVVEKSVNSICPVCGMKVNPALGTIAYQGKLIGFGCKTCPADFRAKSDTFGPLGIRNASVEGP